MARLLSFAGALACALPVNGCGQADKAEPTGSPGASDVSGFAATTGAFHGTLRDNDLMGFLSYVDQSAVLAPPGEPAVRGKDNIAKWYKAFLAHYRTSSLSLSAKEDLVGGDWAVEFGHFNWTLRPTNRSQTIVDHGSYMQVWKRQADGSWRFAREVWNSSPEGAAKPKT
jgi:ketosteroid isomerase-like protein